MEASTILKLLLLTLFTIINSSSCLRSIGSGLRSTELGFSDSYATPNKGRILKSKHKKHHKHPKSLDRRKEDEGTSILPTNGKEEVVVDKDGSGSYRTIKEALDASSKRASGKRFVIRIKAGVYNEYLTIDNNMRDITFIGDGIGKTVITGSRSNNGDGTWNTATVLVQGDGFHARDLTFQNTVHGTQAVAITVQARAAFYKVGFEGYHDTLYAQMGEQFYRECDIHGTVDFIFGDATAVFQNCNIYVRKSRTGHEMTITASGRKSESSPTGLVIQNCKVMPSEDLKPDIGKYHVYLGRPWADYARTVFIGNRFDVPIDPKGWMPMGNDHPASTIYLREYNNKGDDSYNTESRVKWLGDKPTMDRKEAEEFTVKNFFKGESWLSSIGVPYDSGL